MHECMNAFPCFETLDNWDSMGLDYAIAETGGGILFYFINLREFLHKFDTEKFASVTILFSDIVTFTNIAAAVQPMDIVNMLNDLYHKFDDCSEKNDVYKVLP